MFGLQKVGSIHYVGSTLVLHCMAIVSVFVFLFFVFAGLAPKKAEDILPYTSILYANGPGYAHVNGTRGNVSEVDYCKYCLN